MLFAAIILGLTSQVLAQIPADFATSVTSRHNVYRNIHQAANLTWSTSIASVAQTHVSSCKFVLYSGSGNYGQILAAGGFESVVDVVDFWYKDGAAAYDYNNPGFSQATGAFTQVVWKASSQIGCGYQDCDGINGTPGAFVACFYSPAGNVLGRFRQNVLPPLTSAAVEEEASAARVAHAASEERKMLAAEAEAPVKRTVFKA